MSVETGDETAWFDFVKRVYTEPAVRDQWIERKWTPAHLRLEVQRVLVSEVGACGTTLVTKAHPETFGGSFGVELTWVEAGIEVIMMAHSNGVVLWEFRKAGAAKTTMIWASTPRGEWSELRIEALNDLFVDAWTSSPVGL